MKELIGKKHHELLNWLSDDWLEQGPCVCFIEGFSGSGKTSIAIEFCAILEKLKESPSFIVNVPESGADIVGDLLLHLAGELEKRNIKDLTHTIDKSQNIFDKLLGLEKLLMQHVVVVFDEFQNAFIPGTGRPLDNLRLVFEQLKRRPDLKGRLLLLAHRSVEKGRWSEHHEIRKLPNLPTQEAEILLNRLLKDKDREQNVPIERRQDVVKWLGGNPRALEVLVAALECEHLDALIGLNPDIWELRDREISEKLLHDLERDFLQCISKRLPEPTLIFLQYLSVYRKPFKFKALKRIYPNQPDLWKMRDELISRFLLELNSDHYTMNPVIREIALHQLKQKPEMLKKAHAMVANDYMRHFKAKQIGKSDKLVGKLGGYFVEARYHLVRAGLEDQLKDIAHFFENYLKAEMSDFKTPADSFELNERIALLSGLLEHEGAKGLEYYLAKLLSSRNKIGDLDKALIHARRARSNFHTANWILLINIETKVNGVSAAILVAKEGIAMVPEGKNSFALYKLCGELLARENRHEEAIELLKQGIDKIPADKGISALYKLCGELLGNCNKHNEAIALLKKGIDKIPVDKAVVELYQSCGELLARVDRHEEAIALLKQGIDKVPADRNSFVLYKSCGELLARENRHEEAIELLKQGIDKIPADKSVVSIYQSCGELLAKTNQHEEAIELLKQGIAKVPVDKGRRYIVNQALFLCFARNDSITLKQINDMAPDPRSKDLAQVIQYQLDNNWQKAAETASNARKNFPSYVTLYTQEAFSWLCAGLPERAEQTLNELPSEINLENNPIAWLKAFIELRLNKQEKALNSVCDYLGRSLEKHEKFNESFLLSSWDIKGSILRYNFPKLPPCLTGLSKPITCLQNDLPVLTDLYKKEKSNIKKEESAASSIKQESTDVQQKSVQINTQKPKTEEKQEQIELIYILHLSDMHIDSSDSATVYLSQLESDLLNQLNINKLDYLIISGDIGIYSAKEEYLSACELVNGLMKRFEIDKSRIIIAPGNHDLNWKESKKAYSQVSLFKKMKFWTKKEPNSTLHKERFSFFNKDFYKKITSGTYPSDYDEQGILHIYSDHNLLFLSLNSCWEIDHLHEKRSSIHGVALANALQKARKPEYKDWLKIGVWHHPVTGKEMINDEFMQQLTVNGFKICMHGHIHEAKDEYFRYDSKHGIRIIGAGTFGAPAPKQVPGIPLQYNLLTFNRNKNIITVETRKKEKPSGSWKADARWGDSNNPSSKYDIALSEPELM